MVGCIYLYIVLPGHLKQFEDRLQFQKCQNFVLSICVREVLDETIER